MISHTTVCNISNDQGWVKSSQFWPFCSLFRIREQSALLQALRNSPTYSDIPSSIRDYLEYNSKPTISQTFDPLRTLTPTSNLPPPPPTASPQPQISHSPSMFPRMNSGPPINNQQQYTTGNGSGGGGVGRENPSQKGVNY